MIKEAEITEVFSDELINKDVIGWVFLFYLQIFYSTNENFWRLILEEAEKYKKWEFWRFLMKY